MALPTILVDSATGSDTQASGAGPATALFGTTDASTDGAGTTVTLTAGTDLTNVATDGSHVIYLADATAGNRNFGKITGSAGSGGATPTVTVANAFGLTLTNKSWAIGGKRASIGSTTSKKLFDNNGAAGDAMPGWIVEMKSAHGESISAAIDMRRAGDTTSGAIILRGVSGAGTLPKISVTANVNGFVLRAAYLQLRDFEITAASASVTSAIIPTTAANSLIQGIKLSRTSTNVFTTGFDWASFSQDCRIVGCEIQRCGVGIKVSTSTSGMILNNYIHDCTSHGIDLSAADLGVVVYGNIIAACGGDGIHSSYGNATMNRSMVIAHNTIDSCTSDGIEFTAAMSDALSNVHILNNELSNNGGYGINFSNGAVTLIGLQSRGMIVKGNNTYNNTSGAYLPASLGEGDPGLNPTFTNAAGADYSIGTNLKAQGYPIGGTLPVGKTSATYSYVDIGAAQRAEAGGSGGVMNNPGMVGGIQRS